MASRLTLTNWIEQLGTAEVARLLRVNQSAVGHWKRGFCLPRGQQMLAIKKLTKGRLTCDQMIEDHVGGAR